MLWGMPSLVEFETLEENLSLCRGLGLDFIELNMNLPMFQPEVLEGISPCSDVFFTLHLDENFCPADFNPMISEAWMKTMLCTLRLAKRLGAPVINMHMSKGVYFTLPDRKEYLFDRFRNAYMKRMLDLREMCRRELTGSGTRVCIENTGGYLGFQKEAIDLLLESDVFALTWDIGHWYKGQIDDGPFIRAREEWLKHFHIHDAGEKGDHLVPGDGEIDIEGMLSLAKACGASCVLETKTAAALQESVEWLRKHGWM